MKNGLIYISYSAYEYVNYFHLIIDDEVILKFIPSEEIDKVFCKLDQMGIEDNDITWYIIADQDAVDWEYENAFIEKGRKINPGGKIDFSHISTLLENELGVNFSSENVKDANNLRVYFPKQIKNNYLSIDGENVPDKAQKIVNHANLDDGITEFAKIVMEKYERNCVHE